MSAEGGSPGGRVYFVQAGEGGPIKIGWTGGSPRARMASLQTGNPEPLRLLASAPGTPEDERGLHERFAAHRMTGEWFRPAAEIVAFVDGVAFAEREDPDAATAPIAVFAGVEEMWIQGVADARIAQREARILVGILGLVMPSNVRPERLPNAIADRISAVVNELEWVENGEAGIHDTAYARGFLSCIDEHTKLDVALLRLQLDAQAAARRKERSGAPS